MTGGCRGYCVLKIPTAHEEPVTGFAGLSGRLVSFSKSMSMSDLGSLQIEFHRIGSMIRNIRLRLVALEAFQSRNSAKKKDSAFKSLGS